MKPPGPRSLVGLWNTLRFIRDPLGFPAQLAKSYGDVVYCRFGPYRAYFLFHPDHIHQLLIEKQKSFHKFDRQKKVLAQWDGNGLVLSEGAEWLRQRRLVQPAFQPKRFAQYAEIMTDRIGVAREEWKRQAASADGEMDLTAAMTDLTLDVFCRTMFGADLLPQAPQIRQAVADLSEIAVREMQRLLPIPNWLPTSHNRRKRRAMKLLDDIVRDFIVRWREHGEDRGDLLSMLLLATDDQGDGKRMTMQQARDELMVLLLGGHDTTAAALIWTLHLLSDHADAQQQVNDEVHRIVGTRPPTFEDTRKLAYTNAVIKESMRLYPPAMALFVRQAVEPVELAGCPLKKGDLVYTFPWVVHRDPRWFPEPEQFDPQRFLSEQEQQRPQFAYFPFGGGPRVCVGNTFAMMEMALIVAMMLQEFQLQPSRAPTPIQLSVQMSLRPKHNLRVRLKEKAQLNKAQ